MVKLRGFIYMSAFDWSYSGIRIRKSFVLQISSAMIFGLFKLYIYRNILFQADF